MKVSRNSILKQTFIGLTKRYPIIGEDPPAEKKIEVILKMDEKGKEYLVDAEGKRLFTQEHMNTEIGKARSKAAETNKSLIDQLEELKAKASTSEAMKDELQQQIENLQQASLSKEEQMVNKVRSLEDNLKKTQETMTQERDRALKLWEDEKISNALMSAVELEKAFSFKQIHALLRGSTQLKPIIGPDGKPTGQHEVLVTLDVPDEQGAIETKQLAPREALKTMKMMSSEYGNLFPSPEKAGVGGGQSSSGNIVHSDTPPKEALTDMNAYKAWVTANQKG